MLVEQVKEPVAKGSKNQYQNSALQLAKNINSENFSSAQPLWALFEDSGYERMSSIFSVNCSYKKSKMALFWNNIFAKTNIKAPFYTLLRALILKFFLWAQP